MNMFNFKKRNLTSGPHLLGTLLTIAGLFAIVSPTFLTSGSSLERILIVGIGAIIIGLVIVFSYNGTSIDFNGNRFKEYTSFAGYKFGEWRPLPEISKVKVISKSYLATNSPNGISPTLSGRVTDFKTFLYSDSSSPLLSFEYSNKNKAIKQATQLATSLNVDLVLNIPDED